MKDSKKWSQPSIKKFGSSDSIFKTATSTDEVATSSAYPKVGPLCGESILRYGTSCLIRTGNECKMRNAHDCYTARYGPECFTRMGQPCN